MKIMDQALSYLWLGSEILLKGKQNRSVKNKFLMAPPKAEKPLKVKDKILRLPKTIIDLLF